MDEFLAHKAKFLQIVGGNCGCENTGGSSDVDFVGGWEENLKGRRDRRRQEQLYRGVDEIVYGSERSNIPDRPRWTYRPGVRIVSVQMGNRFIDVWIDENPITVRRFLDDGGRYARFMLENLDDSYMFLEFQPETETNEPTDYGSLDGEFYLIYMSPARRFGFPAGSVRSIFNRREVLERLERFEGTVEESDDGYATSSVEL